MISNTINKFFKGTAGFINQDKFKEGDDKYSDES